MDQTVQLLNSKGINPSFNRVSIMKFLLNTDSHPTVDEIYNEIKKYKSNLSKMTIYNVLQLLTQNGLARAVNISEKEVRYDAKIKDHAHFKCNNCHCVKDIDIDFMNIQAEDITDFQVDQRDVFFYGLCPECKQKMN